MQITLMTTEGEVVLEGAEFTGWRIEPVEWSATPGHPMSYQWSMTWEAPRESFDSIIRAILGYPPKPKVPAWIMYAILTAVMVAIVIFIGN